MNIPLPEPGKYYLYDYESGWPYQVTKEVYEQHQAMKAEMSKRISEMCDPPLKGQILIFGTGGDFNCNDFNKVFYNPKESSLNTQETGIINYFKPAYMTRQYTPPSTLQDKDPMPIGKHKGMKMEEVPAKYLLYMYENYEDLHEGVRKYIEANLDVIKQQAKSE